MEEINKVFEIERRSGMKEIQKDTLKKHFTFHVDAKMEIYKVFFSLASCLDTL